MVPSLQNPYMLAHPPLLYLGYVGLTVPFAFAMGALLSRRTDERWIVATRRWTLAAWTFLGVGQLIGAHWAYVEIGWGGYYAWDPVENAALMPWLAATAFLHSVMIQEKRGMLKVWNMVLVALAFNLSLFGTFLTRSGVIDSIHSFAQSSIGGWFLGFLVAHGRLLGRADPLAAAAAADEDEARVARLARGDVPLQQPAARRALPDDPLGRPLPDPLARRCAARRARSRSRTTTSSCTRSGCRCCLLMGLGPLVAWRQGVAALAREDVPHAVRRGRRDRRRVLLALGFGSSWPGLLAYTFCGLRRRLDRARVRARTARAARRRSSGSIGRNRRRYGGYVVHAAIVLLAIGIAGSSAYQTHARAARCGRASRSRRPATRSRTTGAPA